MLVYKTQKQNHDKIYIKSGGPIRLRSKPQCDSISIRTLRQTSMKLNFNRDFKPHKGVNVTLLNESNISKIWKKYFDLQNKIMVDYIFEVNKILIISHTIKNKGFDNNNHNFSFPLHFKAPSSFSFLYLFKDKIRKWLINKDTSFIINIYK